MGFVVSGTNDTLLRDIHVLNPIHCFKSAVQREPHSDRDIQSDIALPNRRVPKQVGTFRSEEFVRLGHALSFKKSLH